MGSTFDRLKDRLVEIRAAVSRPGSLQRTVAVVCVSLLALALFVMGAVALTSARRSSGTDASSGEVVLYSSVDAPFLAQVVAPFESRSGLRVRLVTDTEATKTFGLVQRLIDEKNSPRADVWWSGEPLGSERLAAEGVLDPTLSSAEASLPGGWPVGLRGRDQTWYGHALRARVIAFHTNLYTRQTAPRTLRELAGQRFAGRVGMARPQFGTTRTHLAALIAAHGEPATSEWLSAMHGAGLRLYDGNASVVRAIAQGEIDLALTDTDDVWAGQREGWPVDLVFEAVDKPDTRPTPGLPALPSIGPLVMPFTAAKVRGGPNPTNAKVLLDYLLSADVERLLASSDSRNFPIRPELRAEFEKWWVSEDARAAPAGVPGRLRPGVRPGPAPAGFETAWPDWGAIARQAGRAAALGDEVLGPGPGADPPR
jgi:iron(III) transport system substrate-binding protein